MSEPPITIAAVHYSAGGNSPVNRIVIHATAPGLPGTQASASGQAYNTAKYFQKQSSGGSAHYVMDAGSNEQHCVRDTDRAWHAPPNNNSIGIEICGEATYSRSQWESPSVWPAVVKAADRTRELCNRFGIPKAKIGASDLVHGKIGICGHKDVSDAWHQSSHWDPGTGFPWDSFIALVGGGGGTPEEDDVADTDVTAEVRVSDRAWYQVQRNGGVKVVGNDRQGIANEPFHNYYIISNEGNKYAFGPNKNGGVFSYPGLPASARQGSRYFVAIGVGD